MKRKRAKRAPPPTPPTTTTADAILKVEAFPHHPYQVLLAIAKRFSKDGVILGVHVRGPDRCDREPMMAYSLGAMAREVEGVRSSWSPVELLQVFHALNSPFPTTVYYREVSRTATKPEELAALILLLLTDKTKAPCQTLKAVEEAASTPKGVLL